MNKVKQLLDPSSSWVAKLAAFAKKAGMNEFQIKSEFENFKDHEFNTEKKDWPAVWRIWCRNWNKWSNNETNRSKPDDFDSLHSRNRTTARLD